jgi:hypothetical protein
MANDHHMAILEKGVGAWNEWRSQHPEIRPDLNSAILDGRDLAGIQLDHADLGVAKLRGVNCQDAVFHATHLMGTDFTGANLQRASFPGAHMVSTNFSDADLRDANLTLAVLYYVRMDGADLSGAMFGYTMVGCVDFALALGVDKMRFAAPSAVSIDTLFASRGDIPLEFLAGTGVPRDFLEFFAVSVLNQWARFPSCFISYSTEDRAFVDRTYRALRRKGIECWYAPESLISGSKLRPSIDQAIHAHGKMLLVLSRSSIRSQWVEQEVESALALERKYKRSILFPIRLDDDIMSIDEGWPAFIRNTRHIADFRDWKERGSYMKALGRLIHDLKGAGGATGTAPAVDFRTGWSSYWGELELKQQDTKQGKDSPT